MKNRLLSQWTDSLGWKAIVNNNIHQTQPN